MKCKKGLSLILALALVFSPLSVLNTAAYAEDAQPTVAAEEDPEPTPTAAPEPTPTVAPEPTRQSSPFGMEGPGIEENGEFKTFTPAPTPTAAPEATPTAAPEATPTAAPEPTPTVAPEPTPTAAPEPTPTVAPEPTPTVAPEPTPTAAPEPTPTAESADEQQENDAGIAPASLLPVKVTNAYLYLTAESGETLKSMTLEQVLQQIVDGSGRPLTTEFEGKTVVWGLCKNEYRSSEYLTTEDFDVVFNRSTPVDLYNEGYYEYDDNKYTRNNYSMMILAGTGKQLDYTATRYVVRVIEDNQENISFTLYRNGTPEKDPLANYDLSNVNKSRNEKNVNVEVLALYPKDYAAGRENEYRLAITSSMKNRNLQDVHVVAYRLTDYLNNGTAAPDVWDDVFSEKEPFKPMKTAVPGEDEVICLAYLDKDDKELLGIQGFAYRICSPENLIKGGAVYANENGTLVNVTKDTYERSEMPLWVLDKERESYLGMVPLTRTAIKTYYLKDGYDLTREYRLVFDKNDNVQSIYRIATSELASTEQEAIKNGDENVTAQIFDKNVGYPLKAGYGITLIVFYKDGTREILNVGCWRDYSSYGSSTSPSSPSLYFNVTGAQDVVAQKIVANGSYDSQDLDSYAYNGYMTFFVLDPKADLRKLKLNYTARYYSGVEGSEEDADVHYLDADGNSHLLTQDAEINFDSGKPIQFTVSKYGLHENYWVTFAKKTEGTKLFVSGPINDPKNDNGQTYDYERELYLTDELHNRHSILIANLGTADLKNVRVWLEDGSSDNIKLDDYWTVDGETLKALTEADTAYGTNLAYLNNMAMIRIYPTESKNMEIKGTLVISAEGLANNIRIQLTGLSKNPEIQNSTLAGGVKYVPYSEMLLTDNPWRNKIKESFSVTGLPKGLEVNHDTGEIYGVPKEAGTFTVRAYVHYTRVDSTDSLGLSESNKTFTLTIKDNSNQNVFSASDEGYELETPIGIDAGGNDYVLSSSGGTQLFVSRGNDQWFKALYLNGEPLERDKEYKVEHGSTRITLLEGTLLNKAKIGEINTLAAEFREEGDPSKKLHRTAQNFRLLVAGQSGGNTGASTGSGNDNKAEDDDSDDVTATPAPAPVSTLQYATLTVRVTDANGKGLSGLTVELHSAPRSGVSNANGYVTFSNVPFGTHTLYVKNASGKTMASRTFVFGGSTTVGISGGNVLAAPGGAVMLTVRLNGNTLSFVSAIPQTGDDFDPALYMVLVLLSAAGLLGLGVWHKRRSRNAG